MERQHTASMLSVLSFGVVLGFSKVACDFITKDEADREKKRGYVSSN